LNIQDIDRNACVLITGGTGLVGRALTRVLADKGFSNITSVGSKDCDLRDGEAVKQLFTHVKPRYLFHLAARVYGIGGNNKYKADILFDNVMINTNVLEHARGAGVKKIEKRKGSVRKNKERRKMKEKEGIKAKKGNFLFFS